MRTAISKRCALSYRVKGGWIVLYNLGPAAAASIQITQSYLGATDIRLQQQGWGYSPAVMGELLPRQRTLLTEPEVARVRAYIQGH